MELTRLRGFRDLIGPDARLMSMVEERARDISIRSGFTEIRIPLIEREDLYERSTGDTTDIVQKQIYLVQRHAESAGEGQLALRPEGTPGVVRAYIEAGLDRREPEQRFFYSGPMLRYERPQRGRYREFYQFGVEVFGRADPMCDAELLVFIEELRATLGLKLRFEINSIGDAECRPKFRAALVEFGRAHLDALCQDCHQRLAHNPLRLLDCKIDVKLMEKAPQSTDYLCAPCSRHFATLKNLLGAAGIAYVENPRLVRGLDYYSRTTFEVIAEGLGAQSTVVAGGRYDGLVEAMGGATVPGIGFGIGIDRMALALEAAGVASDAQPDAAIIALGDAAMRTALTLAKQLREAGLTIELLSPERRMRALLARADKIGARLAVIVGEDELKRGVVQLRDLKKSEQREVAIGDVASAIAATPRA